MEVFRLIALTTFSLLCGHHFSDDELSIISNRNSVPIKHKLPPPILPAPGTHHSTFCLYAFDGSGDLA